MEVIAMPLNMNGSHFALALREAGARLDTADGEAILDLSSVSRIDTNALRALEHFAQIANEKGVKVVLRGVNVDIYKVFKLAKLTRRLSFENRFEQLPRS